MNAFDNGRQIRKRLARAAIFLALAWLAASGARPSAKDKPASQPGYQVLDSELTALRQRFNEDADHPRILMLLSPT